MGFSKKVQRDVLIGCARHCCVCHRYKGIKIEVHHLVQNAKGGSNTFENAIPLCFDCHCDAGHYSSNHPRGTKFSMPELREARDKWYENVKNNSIIEKRDTSNQIHTSYYVLNSFEVLESAIKGELSTVIKHRNRVFLSKSSVLKNWTAILKSHMKEFGSNTDQVKIIEIKPFNSVEEYILEYEGVEVIDKSCPEYPYYEAKRKLNWEAIQNTIKPNFFF